jgi:hypothetical protein
VAHEVDPPDVHLAKLVVGAQLKRPALADWLAAHNLWNWCEYVS